MMKAKKHKKEQKKQNRVKRSKIGLGSVNSLEDGEKKGKDRGVKLGPKQDTSLNELDEEEIKTQSSDDQEIRTRKRQASKHIEVLNKYRKSTVIKKLTKAHMSMPKLYDDNEFWLQSKTPSHNLNV